MEVDGFPVRVVARVERPAVHVELIGEYELKLLPIPPPRLRMCLCRGVYVDEPAVPCNVWYLVILGAFGYS